MTIPTTQAGHQMHQITTAVYIPHTFQPKLAPKSTSAREIRHSWAAEYMTTGGATALSNPAREYLMTGLALGWTKVKGLVSSPTRKAREKLSVASVAKDIPSKSKEKDFRI